MRYRVADIRKSPDWHKIVSAGRLSGDGKYIEILDREETIVKPAPLAPNASTAHVAPVWPVWVKGIAKMRRDGDKGVGDTLERVLGPFGGTAFKIAFKALTGRNCGCDVRKDRLNSAYSYNGPLMGG